MLTLSLRHMPEVPLEVDCLAPQKVADVAAPLIAKLRVRHGRNEVELGEFFQVRGDAHDLYVVVEGDCSGVKWLGAGMTQGHMTIVGAAGMHAGSGMTGGELEIRGDADDWLAAEMRGGIARVTGNAGHHSGAAYPGGRRGMRGGTLLVDGQVGDGCGAVMRRGIIAVGSTGDYCGASMIAGTIVVRGTLGRYAGMAMKRGTIVALGRMPELLPTFRESCEYHPAFMAMYGRHLESLGFRVRNWPALYRRFCGDLVSLGQGEVLVPAGS